MQRRIGVRGAVYAKNRKRIVLGTKEKRRVLQLLLCIGLFLIILTGKGVAPETWNDSRALFLHAIQTDTDFKSVISNFSRVFSGESLFVDSSEVLSTDVLEETETEEFPFKQYDDYVKQGIMENLKKAPTAQSVLEQLGLEVGEEEFNRGEDLMTDAEQPSIPVVEVPVYTGPALPAGASMEYYELGLAEIIAPVKGEVTSVFGYRDHPVDGEHSFHTGADIAADIGTPIAAFAAGTVDFIGESEAYGLYIQLDHGNGVTTFYCHCHELLAKKGETVSVGQTIATVGDTGNATGPHLHIELERDGVFLNPLYYFEGAV